MGKIDSLKEKIDILRDDYRNIFIFFMAVLTGSFTIFFLVVVGKIVVIYSFIGLDRWGRYRFFFNNSIAR